MEMGNQVVIEEVTQQKEKISFWKKAEKFLDKHYAVIFAPLIVLALYIAMLSYLDVYPFGNRYTAASYDSTCSRGNLLSLIPIPW